jgi:hypothetical protein
MTEPTDQPLQLTVFGEAVPIAEVQRGICTRSDDCQAEADQHEPDCPVELKLIEEMGF